MLSDAACSPCFEFKGNNDIPARLSPADLKDVLLWAAATPAMPELYFLVDVDEPLDPAVALVLEDMGDQVITPLMSAEKQESLGIPFSVNQTVIADNLRQLVTEAENIAGRPVILHVERSEIPVLAESLLAIQRFIGTLRLCLRDIHLLEDDDLQTYKEQLAGFVDVALMKQATGTEGRFRLLNSSVSGLGRQARCPAGTGFITIGPDGCVYPCPAFYRAGREYSLGSLEEMAEQPRGVKWDCQKCSICGSIQCPGCPFLETSQFPGKGQMCKVYEVESRASDELLHRVAQFGYKFDCLRTLKARECALKSQREGGEGLTAGKQVFEITFDDFTKALRDLKSAAESVLDESPESGFCETLMSRWSELPGIPATAQKNIFQGRVLETLRGICQFRNPLGVVAQGGPVTQGGAGGAKKSADNSQ